MLVRVRCVDDGSELLIKGRRLEWRVQVATIKRLVLQQRQYRRPSSADEGSSQDADEELSACFLLFQGRILADSDMVNLFSLTPADFFVFVQDPESSGESDDALTDDRVPGTGRIDPHLRQQLLEMGFTSAQANGALRRGETKLDQLVECIMSGGSEEAAAVQPAQRQCGRSQEQSVHPEEQELQQKALADPFDAVMLLKEHFSSDALASLIESPASTIQTLRRATTRTVRQPGAVANDAAHPPAFQDTAADDQESKHDGPAPDDASNPIERLSAMGFARDLVEAMYESCGFDEQLAANALLQTLET